MGKNIVPFIMILFLMFPALKLYAQDSIPVASDVQEEIKIQFQESFFKSLSEKSITNYQRAITYLETCNNLISNEISVLFELSKNYFMLGKFLEAQRYVEKALEQRSDDLWMLEHLVLIHEKDANFEEAIKVQLKIIENHPNKRNELVYLYIKNNNDHLAIRVLKDLEKENNISTKLLNLRNKLIQSKQPIVTKPVVVENTNLKEKFNNTQSFNALKLLLESLEKQKNQQDLLKYSAQGLSLFPAQSFVYLMYGKALISQKFYKKALLILQQGLDFVIENKVEADFYDVMVVAFQQQGNIKKVEMYRLKAAQLRNK